jgi:ribosomal protein L16 Arg81 hydroxylase
MCDNSRWMRVCVSDSCLQWLIDPFSKSEFLQQYWETDPLVVNRNQPNYFCSLLSLDEVDRVLTTLDLRCPNVTLKKC